MLKKFDFKGQSIRMEKRADGHIRVCLTDMAKASGKKVSHWNELKMTKEFINKIEKEKGFKVLEKKQGGIPEEQGTWAVEEIADEFYRWCTFQEKKDMKQIKGFIYIFKDAGNNALKIGFTKDLKIREKQHKTSNPFLELVDYFPNMSYEVETVIHEKLKIYRIKNTTEWYKNSLTVIKTVHLLCKENITE